MKFNDQQKAFMHSTSELHVYVAPNTKVENLMRSFPDLAGVLMPFALSGSCCSIKGRN